MQNNCTGVDSYQNLIRRSGRSPKSLDITGFFGFFRLFPLNSCRWFRGDVVADAVDMVNLVDDADGNLVENLVRDSCPVSGHEVGGCNAAECEGIIVGSEVAHNAYGAHVCQNCEVLVNRLVQTSFSDLVAEDEVSFAQNIQFFLGDVADNTDSKTRTREWLTVYQIIRQTELTAECANFVLEQQTQRLDDFLEVNIVRKAAHIVVRFDNGRVAGTGFNNISVDCTLCKEVNLADLFGFFLEYADKLFADDLAFLFRLTYACLLDSN